MNKISSMKDIENNLICGENENKELKQKLNSLIDLINDKTEQFPFYINEESYKKINYGFVCCIFTKTKEKFWLKVFLNKSNASDEYKKALENNLKREKEILNMLKNEVHCIVPYIFYDKGHLAFAQIEQKIKQIYLKHKESKVVAFMMSPHVNMISRVSFSYLLCSFFLMQKLIKEKKILHYDIHFGNVREYNKKFIFIDLGGICNYDDKDENINCKNVKTFYKNKKIDRQFLEQRVIFSTFMTCVSVFFKNLQKTDFISYPVFDKDFIEKKRKKTLYKTTEEYLVPYFEELNNSFINHLFVDFDFCLQKLRECINQTNIINILEIPYQTQKDCTDFWLKSHRSEEKDDNWDYAFLLFIAKRDKHIFKELTASSSLLRNIYEMKYITFEAVIEVLSNEFFERKYDIETSSDFYENAKKNLNYLKKTYKREIHFLGKNYQKPLSSSPIKKDFYSFFILNTQKKKTIKQSNYVTVKVNEFFGEEYVIKMFKNKNDYTHEKNMHQIVNSNQELDKLFVPSLCTTVHDEEKKKDFFYVFSIKLDTPSDEDFNNLRNLLHFSYLVQSKLVEKNVVYADAHKTNIAKKSFTQKQNNTKKYELDYTASKDENVIRFFMIDYGGITNTQNLIEDVSLTQTNENEEGEILPFKYVFRYVHKSTFTNVFYFKEENVYTKFNADGKEFITINSSTNKLSAENKQNFLFAHGMFTMLLAYAFHNFNHKFSVNNGLKLKINNQYQISDDIQVCNYIVHKLTNWNNYSQKNIILSILNMNVKKNEKFWNTLKDYDEKDVFHSFKKSLFFRF